MEPIAARDSDQTWHPVFVQCGKVVIGGGWSKDVRLADTVQMDTPREDNATCQLQLQWLSGCGHL